MAKLSHIDDFNEDNLDDAMRKAAAQTRQTLDKKQATVNAQNAESSSAQKANAQSAVSSHAGADSAPKSTAVGAENAASVRTRSKNAGGQKANAQAANARRMRSTGKKEQESKEEEDLDGIDSEPMPAGQKLIIVIAFVALAAVICYLLNYWFHFV